MQVRIRVPGSEGTEPYWRFDGRTNAPMAGRVWHRRAIGGRKTACGKDADPEHGRVDKIRHETYRGPLCEGGCFTAYEIALGADLTWDDNE